MIIRNRYEYLKNLLIIDILNTASKVNSIRLL